MTDPAAGHRQVKHGAMSPGEEALVQLAVVSNLTGREVHIRLIARVPRSYDVPTCAVGVQKTIRKDHIPSHSTERHYIALATRYRFCGHHTIHTWETGLL